jgi:hypothetical protein
MMELGSGLVCIKTGIFILRPTKLTASSIPMAWYLLRGQKVIGFVATAEVPNDEELFVNDWDNPDPVNFILWSEAE